MEEQQQELAEGGVENGVEERVAISSEPGSVLVEELVVLVDVVVVESGHPKSRFRNGTEAEGEQT